MKRPTTLLLFAALALGLLPFFAGRAQSPAPVIIQAVTPARDASAPVPSARAGTSAQPDSKTIVQTLQEMQNANAETIKKQEAALEALDVLQKAAEEIKIYSKRG